VELYCQNTVLCFRIFTSLPSQNHLKAILGRYRIQLKTTSFEVDQDKPESILLSSSPHL